MARIADVFRFRAEAVRLNWAEILENVPFPTLIFTPPALIELQERVRQRSGDIRVTWATAKELGVPYEPFTVWVRGRERDDLREVDVTTWWTLGGLAMWWGGEQAARVRVTCEVSGDAPVGLFLFRTAPSVGGVVAAEVVHPDGQSSITVDLRTSGAVFALLVNGWEPQVRITLLDDVINDDSWKPFERVGLPVEDSWPGTEYDTGLQGPLDSPRSPREAAIWRLTRGGPPFGWHWMTQSGIWAPPWSAPEPEALIDEVQKFVLPEITGLYDGSVPEYEQWKVTGERKVDAPEQGGRHSELPTKADAKPWGTLAIPAHTDAFLNLAMGFGTCYSLEPLSEEHLAVGNTEFLITARFRKVLPEGSGDAEFAAYAPPGSPHRRTAAPTPVTAVRDGLVPPPARDLPWGETIRIAWKLPAVSAGMATPTESALVRYQPGATEAEPLIERMDPSGWRPLAISPDPIEGAARSDRTSVVDGGAEIPIGSGGRAVGYSVAVADLYGVWSPWRDAAYTGNEPGPEGARVISLALGTTYAGSTSCPGALRLEVATEWLQRTPSSIQIAAVFFPMATPASWRSDLTPEGAAPLGCFRRDLDVVFAGDDPAGVGCDVAALNPDGDGPATPGPAQGDGGRRYGVSTAVTLDFSATRRWGVQVWARRHLLVGHSPSAWAPGPAAPALTSAASPVPVAALPVPPLPGVPLASLPDAEGRAHARIAWSLPSGAPVRRTAVWEVAETALRQTVGLPPHVPDDSPPGARLLALRNAYDSLPVTERRSLFRRVSDVEGSLRTYDAVLPKGSTDIHLFAVTPITDTGIEAPWPGGTAETVLQAFMAPRLRRPAPPLVRSHPSATGVPILDVSSASRIPVARFRLLRTRSETAARRADTMGPAFAEVAVTAAPAAADPVTGDPVYTASWTGAFPESWDEWHVRAIAIPVDTMPVHAVRGLPSDPSDVVTLIALPTVPPDLAPLVVETDAAHTGITIRTSTAAPARPVPAGDHRAAATAGSDEVPPTVLPALPETSLGSPPPASTIGPVLERGARASGRTPLALWLTRPVAADPVEVAIRITDPLGRITERSETVPGWVPPPPAELVLVDSFQVIGRGVAVVVASNAPVGVTPPYELSVRATGRPTGPVFPPRPPRRMRGSAKLPNIRRTGAPTPRNAIQFGWREGDDGGRLYDIWIPMTAPMSALVALIAPDGGRVTVAVTEE